jgi:putative membrane protein
MSSLHDDTNTTRHIAQLAADRTLYAAERTYAAWMRTGLAALAGSVAAKPLLVGSLPDFDVRGAGAILAAFSLFCFSAAIWREVFGMTHKLEADARRFPRGILYLVNALLGMVSVMAFVATVFG